MPPLPRKAALAVHVLVSIGWIGAAAVYLTLGVAAEVSPQAATVRASWIGMELIGWLVIVPLGCLALTTGIVMSLATPWTLVRHFWVLLALVLTAVALGVLLHSPASPRPPTAAVVATILLFASAVMSSIPRSDCSC
jgi:hypothetical protein